MKKLIAIISLLFLLTSCGETETVDVGGGLTSTGTEIESDINNIDNLDSTEIDTGTGTEINATGSLSEDQILEDIDNLLQEIIDSAEEDDAVTNTGATDITSTGTTITES